MSEMKYMKNKNKTTISDAIRSKIVKNGSRGTSLTTLVNTARSIRSSVKKSDVCKTLNRLEAEEVRDGFFTLARY